MALSRSLRDLQIGAVPTCGASLFPEVPDRPPGATFHRTPESCNSPGAIKNMLQLNAKPSESSEGSAQGQEPVWKVLVYDQIGQDIISPLLKVNQLREQGVTVHMFVSTERRNSVRIDPYSLSGDFQASRVGPTTDTGCSGDLFRGTE